MREVDGSAGGGQLLRTALALSALSGDPVRVEDVRGSRPETGRKHQHLAAVELLADVADADVDGAALGAETVEFRPGTVSPGEYEATVGTAGSLTLLFDAVLPLATGIEGPLSVTATGGTDVKWSPTMVYYRRVKLPLLARHGLAASVEPHRRGFYPEGGGRATLRIHPSTVCPTVEDRGKRRGARVYSTATRSLADDRVAARQAVAAEEELTEAGLSVGERRTSVVEAACPGSAVLVRLDYGSSLAGFDALGEPGRPAEAVAGEAVEAALAFDRGAAAVDVHLADQLLPFLALARGTARIPAVTDHVATTLDLLTAFGYDLEVEAFGDGTHRVRG